MNWREMWATARYHENTFLKTIKINRDEIYKIFRTGLENQINKKEEKKMKVTVDGLKMIGACRESISWLENLGGEIEVTPKSAHDFMSEHLSWFTDLVEEGLSKTLYNEIESQAAKYEPSKPKMAEAQIADGLAELLKTHSGSRCNMHPLCENHDVESLFSHAKNYVNGVMGENVETRISYALTMIRDLAAVLVKEDAIKLKDEPQDEIERLVRSAVGTWNEKYDGGFCAGDWALSELVKDARGELKAYFKDDKKDFHLLVSERRAILACAWSHIGHKPKNDEEAIQGTIDFIKNNKPWNDKYQDNVLKDLCGIGGRGRAIGEDNTMCEHNFSIMTQEICRRVVDGE